MDSKADPQGVRTIRKQNSIMQVVRETTFRMSGATRKQKTVVPWAGREKKARIKEEMIKRRINKKKEN